MTYILPLTGSRFDRTSCGTRALNTRELRRNGEGDIYEGKRRNLLRLPIVEQLEIVDREADNQIALLVGDGSIDFDEVDLGLEG